MKSMRTSFGEECTSFLHKFMDDIGDELPLAKCKLRNESNATPQSVITVKLPWMALLLKTLINPAGLSGQNL